MSIEVVNDRVQTTDKHTTHPAKIPGMTGLRERLVSLVERAGGSQRELSRRAGLTEVHVGQIIRRLEKDPVARIEQTTLDAIARGAGVSAAWLSHGVGTPDSTDASPPAPEDHRPVLRNLAGYADAERLAREEHPDWPEWVWEETARASTFDAPVATLALVEDIARLVRRHKSPAGPAVSSTTKAVNADRAVELDAKMRAFEEELEAPPPKGPEPKRGRKK